MSEEATLDEFAVGKDDSTSSEFGVGDLQQLESSPISSWKLVKLGDILSFEYGDNLPSDSRERGKVPVYGSNGQVDTHSEAAVDLPGIVLGRKGSIGKIEFSDESFWPIDTTYYVTQEETDENLRFLHCLLQNIQLERLNAASAIPGLNRNDAYGLNALVPPLEEQRKIASVLYNVERAVQKTEDVINRLERIRTGTLRDLFSHGLDQSDTKDTPMGEFPQNWELRQLSDVGKLINGNAFPKEQQGKKNGDYPFVKVSDTNEYRRYVTGAENYISKAQADEIGCNIQPEGTVILPKRGAAIMTNKRRILAQESAVDNNQIGIVGNDVEPLFLYYYLSDVDMGRFVQEGAVKSLTKSLLSKIRVPVPPSKTQSKIIEILDTIDQRIEAEMAVKSQYSQLRKGLMQDLLSGEVRTTGADIPVLDAVAQHG